MGRETLADVGEGIATTQRACRQSCAVGKHRYVLARVVTAVPGRVAAMICAQDKKIIFFQPFE